MYFIVLDKFFMIPVCGATFHPEKIGSILEIGLIAGPFFDFRAGEWSLYASILEEIYGPTGDWVQLFQKSDGYLGTELHWDVSNELRYVTLDYWASREARDAFREQFAQEFADLDQRCESRMEKEIFLGDFAGFGAYRGFIP
ncbi:MAG: hypothetical protein KDJ52_34670 [Anaerolineae bacterium]|nr:hypothetical protein [Anaerolineae bacterium]